MNALRLPAMLGLLLLVLVAMLFRAVMGWETLFLGDFSDYELPNHLVTAAALAEGQLPHWNSLLHLGLPHLANPTTATFYPLTWVAAIAPVLWWLNIKVIIHLLIAAAGAYLLLGRLGAERGGQALGAVIVALGGPLLSYHANPFYLASAAWTPWVLWAFVRVQQNEVWWRSALACAGFMTLQLFAGDGHRRARCFLRTYLRPRVCKYIRRE